MSDALDAFSGRVRYWQGRFGLSEWELHVKEQVDDKPTEVTVDLAYLRAVIRMNPGIETEDIDHTACHEVAHVFLGEFLEHSGNMREWFTGGHRNALDESWHLAWERTTERLARLMEAQETP